MKIEFTVVDREFSSTMSTLGKEATVRISGDADLTKALEKELLEMLHEEDFDLHDDVSGNFTIT